MGENAAGATFRAKEGYRINVLGGVGDGFTLIDNQDGTYTVDITSESLDWVYLDSVIEVKRLVEINAYAAPAEGGSILMDGSAFEPGYVGGERGRTLSRR